MPDTCVRHKKKTRVGETSYARSAVVPSMVTPLFFFVPCPALPLQPPRQLLVMSSCTPRLEPQVSKSGPLSQKWGQGLISKFLDVLLSETLET